MLEREREREREVTCACKCLAFRLSLHHIGTDIPNHGCTTLWFQEVCEALKNVTSSLWTRHYEEQKTVHTFGPDIKQFQKTMREAVQDQERATMKCNVHWLKFCRAEKRSETLQAETDELTRFFGTFPQRDEDCTWRGHSLWASCCEVDWLMGAAENASIFQINAGVGANRHSSCASKVCPEARKIAAIPTSNPLS